MVDYALIFVAWLPNESMNHVRLQKIFFFIPKCHWDHINCLLNEKNKHWFIFLIVSIFLIQNYWFKNHPHQMHVKRAGIGISEPSWFMEMKMANYKFDWDVNSPSLVTHIRSFELVLWCHELVVFHHGELRVFLFDLSKLRGQITQQRDIFHSTMTNNSWDPSMFSFRPPHTKKAIWKYTFTSTYCLACMHETQASGSVHSTITQWQYFFWFLIQEFVGFNILLVGPLKWKTPNMSLTCAILKNQFKIQPKCQCFSVAAFCVISKQIIYYLFPFERDARPYRKNQRNQRNPASIRTRVSLLDSLVVPIWSQFYKTRFWSATVLQIKMRTNRTIWRRDSLLHFTLVRIKSFNN